MSSTFKIAALRIMIVAISFALASTCRAQEADLINGIAARSAIGDVLNNAQISGSLAYWGNCDAQRPLPGFPDVRRLPKGKEGSVVEVLRAMFADDSEMRVTLDAKGFVRMIEGGVPQELLDVRLNHVSFKDYDGRDGIWVPTQARRIIMNAPEVQSFMRSHQIAWAVDAEYINDISGGPSPKLPHVSGDLYNVTLGEAFDYATKSFSGFWVYGNCRSELHGSRNVFLEIYRVPRLRATP